MTAFDENDQSSNVLHTSFVMDESQFPHPLSKRESVLSGANFAMSLVQPTSSLLQPSDVKVQEI